MDELIVRPGPASINTNESTAFDQIAYSEFYNDPKKYRHWRTTKIDSEADMEDVIKALPGEVFSMWSGDYNAWYVVAVLPEDHILSIDLSKDGQGTMRVMASNVDDAGLHLKKYMELFPIRRDDGSDQKINIDYWSLNAMQQRGSSYTRKINVRFWDDTIGNYPPDVRHELETMGAIQEKDITGGKLVLWHGDPGTGKSNAILSLADRWRSWCKVQYVLDPEALFNVAGYMIDVLSRGEDADHDYWEEDEIEEDSKYRLLIVEDSEEFLRKDAKDRSGQGLSRLLNATDGLIGQGMRCLILITTNEDVKNFHEAVIRPGRCLANIKFEKFTTDQARNWLQQRGGNPRHPDLVENPSLADMYSVLNSSRVIKTAERSVSTGQYL